MILGKIFTGFAKFQGIVSVNDFWLPIRLQELLQASLVSCEVFVSHGYAWIHCVARSCTTTAHRWLFRDSQLSLRTLWSAVIKSPKFAARGTTSQVRHLHGTLVISVLWQISQFRSLGKWLQTLCLPKSSRLLNVGSTLHGKNRRVSLCLQELYHPPNFQWILAATPGFQNLLDLSQQTTGCPVLSWFPFCLLLEFFGWLGPQRVAPFYHQHWKLTQSLERCHIRILLWALPRGRIKETHRELEVPEATVPVVECLDGPARITSKELAPIHSVKNGILQNACSARQIWGKVLLCTPPGWRTAWQKVQKEWWQKFCGHVEKEWAASKNRVPCSGRLFIKYTTIGLRLSGHGAAEVFIPKPIRCVKFTQPLYVTPTFDTKKPSLGMICPGEPHQRNSNPPTFVDRSQEETEWQQQGASEAAWRLVKSILKLKEKNRAAFFSPSECRCLPAQSNLKLEEREFVVDSSASGHMISKKDLNSDEMDTLTKSWSPTTVMTTMEKCRHMKRPQFTSKNWICSWQWESSRIRQQFCRSESFFDEHGYSHEWTNGQNPHLILNGIRIQCNTENFVPIVVPGLSASSSSSSHSSTSMTPSRQETNHPTSSSSSFTSPTTTVSSDSETRAREDLSGTDSCPVSVSSEHVERKERGDLLTKPTKNPKPNKNEDHERERRDLLNSEIPEWLQEFIENLVDDRVPEHRDSHASCSHEPSSGPQRKVVSGKQYL